MADGSNLTDIESVVLPLVQGQPVWIFVAAMLQVLYYFI
jgi:uncharacterized protein YvpB